MVESKTGRSRIVRLANRENRVAAHFAAPRRCCSQSAVIALMQANTVPQPMLAHDGDETVAGISVGRINATLANLAYPPDPCQRQCNQPLTTRQTDYPDLFAHAGSDPRFRFRDIGCHLSERRLELRQVAVQDGAGPGAGAVAHGAHIAGFKAELPQYQHAPSSVAGLLFAGCGSCCSARATALSDALTAATALLGASVPVAVTVLMVWVFR